MGACAALGADLLIVGLMIVGVGFRRMMNDKLRLALVLMLASGLVECLATGIVSANPPSDTLGVYFGTVEDYWLARALSWVVAAIAVVPALVLVSRLGARR